MLSTHGSCGHRLRAFTGIRSLSKICCVVTLPTAHTEILPRDLWAKAAVTGGHSEPTVQDLVLASPSCSNSAVFFGVCLAGFLDVSSPRLASSSKRLLDAI